MARRSSGLSFRRKRKTVEIKGAKNMAMFILEIIIVLFIAFVVVYCAGMQVTAVGNSMEQTIGDGETVLVDRFTYLLGRPKSGDVVVFLPNGNQKSHYYLKRVVGVPGDKVQIKDGILYVNGEMFDQEDTEAIKNPGLVEEVTTIPEGEYFVLGDNSNGSEDSRYANIGNITIDDITGKAWFHIASIKEMGFVR